MQTQIEFFKTSKCQHNEARLHRLQALKQALCTCGKILPHLNSRMNDNFNVQRRLTTANSEKKREQSIVKTYDKLLIKLKLFFRVTRLNKGYDFKKLLTKKNNNNNLDENSMKTQIDDIKKLQDTRENKLNNLQQLQQHESTFDYDVETINFLNTCNWNLGESCDRSMADTLLSCFANGTFLVRSSRTKQNSLVLSLVINSKVKHCLIDKINEQYCFHPPGPTHQFYSSLSSLVMDYRHKSLVCHSPELDINLIYPVLSQIKKINKSYSETGVTKAKEG